MLFVADLCTHMARDLVMQWIPQSATYDAKEASSNDKGAPRARPSSSSAANTKEQSYKTKLCVFYALQGYCIHGDNCTYAHGIDDLVSPAALLTSPPPIIDASRNAASRASQSAVPVVAFPAALDRGGLHETQEPYEGIESSRRWSSRSVVVSAESGREGRTRPLKYPESEPSIGRRWTTSNIRGSAPPDLLFNEPYSGFVEESFLPSASALPTSHIELNNGSCSFEQSPEESSGSRGDDHDHAQLSQSGNVPPQLLLEVLDVLRGYSTPD